MQSLLVFAAEEAGHGPEITAGGPLQEWAWLILVAPFVAWLAIIFWGKTMKHQGAEIAVAMMSFVFGYGLLLWIDTIRNKVVYEHSVVIGDLGGGWVFEWGWIVDGLSSMMYFVVGTVGLLVFIYAVSYMKGEIRYTFFFSVSRCLLVPCWCWWRRPTSCSSLSVGSSWVWLHTCSSPTTGRRKRTRRPV